MALISRKTIFIPGTKILPEDWNSELDQLYRFLSGSLAAQVLFEQKTPNVAFIVENLHSGVSVIDYKKGDVLLAQFLGTQQFKSLITMDAPFVISSRTKVTNLNAQFLSGKPSSAFFNNGRKSYSYFNFVPALGISPGNKSTIYVVPDGTTMQLVEVVYAVSPNVLYDAATVSLSLKKNGVSINTADLTDGNNYAVTNVLATNVAGGDIISLDITAFDIGVGVPPTGLVVTVKMIQDMIS